MQRIKIPFGHLSKNEVHNLAIAAIITFYIVLVGQDIILNNLCGDLAFDYCAYWSGGRVINSSGYKDIYDGDLLYQIQNSIYPDTDTSGKPFEEVPLPYLPFFIIPFQFLSFLDLPYSFIAWTLINLLGFGFYLNFFVSRTVGIVLPKRLLLIILLSLPVFLNINYGQVNIWLGICAGEFFRAFFSGKPLKAGIWLGGWLFKPQLLILILPFLLIRKKFKVLIGFIVTMFVILLISYSLIGEEGFYKLFELIRSSSEGGATSNAQIMMNWRMLGLHTAFLTNRTIGWTVIIVGSVIMTVGTLFIFSKEYKDNQITEAVALVGVFAATCAVTWHAHFSMSIILIPPMIFLILKNQFNLKIFYSWFYAPIIGLLLIYITVALVHLNVLPTFFYELLDLMQGLWGLVFNILFWCWAVRMHFLKPSFQIDLDRNAHF